MVIGQMSGRLGLTANYNRWLGYRWVDCLKNMFLIETTFDNTIIISAIFLYYQSNVNTNSKNVYSQNYKRNFLHIPVNENKGFCYKRNSENLYKLKKM